MFSLGLIKFRRCFCLGRFVLSQGYATKIPYVHQSRINPVVSSCVINQHANFCSTPSDNPNKKRRSIPPLMRFPEIIWPSFLHSFRNWVLVNFIIRPYFDKDFNLKDFIYGAKQAVHVISSKLTNGNFMEIKDLVAPEVVDEIKPVIEKLSVSQRKQLEINKDDIFLSFPYQVGIMFDESNEKRQKRFVEITMVFHVLKGFREMQNQGEVLPWNMGSMPEYENKVFVCNYRFIKEFTVGNETDWTINVLNHFKPTDLLIEDN